MFKLVTLAEFPIRNFNATLFNPANSSNSDVRSIGRRDSDFLVVIAFECAANLGAMNADSTFRDIKLASEARSLFASENAAMKISHLNFCEVIGARALHVLALRACITLAKSASSSAVKTDRTSLQTLRARSSAVKACACRTVEGAGACPTGAFAGAVATPRKLKLDGEQEVVATLQSRSPLLAAKRVPGCEEKSNNLRPPRPDMVMPPVRFGRGRCRVETFRRYPN